jgi:hypothetical protein
MIFLLCGHTSRLGNQDQNKLKIWINAFIPLDLPNLSFQIQSGSHSGEWAIHGPSSISNSFLTDQRSFDINLQTSFRMQSLTEIDLVNCQLLNHGSACGKTVEIDTSNGNEVCSSTANASNILLNNYSTGINPFGKKMINFTLDARASNPCYLAAPGITWKIPVTILIDTSTNKLSVIFDGYTSAFPAFEMYTQVGGADPTVLFQRYPDANMGPGALLLSPDKEIYVAKDIN